MPTSRVPFAGWSGESSSTQRDWLRPSRLSHSSRDVATCLILSLYQTPTLTIIETVLRLLYLVALVSCLCSLFTLLQILSVYLKKIYGIIGPIQFFFFFFLVSFISLLHCWLILRDSLQFANTRHWWLDEELLHHIYIDMHAFCCKKCWISNSFYT